jgi:hypothetical protein
VFSRQFSGKGKLPEFKVIRQVNAGPGAARNCGWGVSTGEFIHFFDSDDIAAPNKHEVQVRALQETGADIAYGPWVKGYVREHGAGPLARSADGSERGVEQGARSGEQAGGRYSFEPEGHVLQQKGLPKGDLIKELLTRWSIVPQACMFRRAIVEKSGGGPRDMFIAEDQLMFLRCLLAGAKVAHTPEAITFYRLGAAGKLTESSTARSKRLTDWLLFLQRAKSECKAYSINPDEWFGFRKRIWAAEKDFAGAESVPIGKPPAVGSRSQRLLYPLFSKAEQWSGGLKVRLTGNRQNASFRCGPITQGQMMLFPAT